ncbi:MAG TPA: ATPase domain-containing protein [Oligoflexus sp.]|uniref:RAD55 family ATPase n=1 Tax=Oligoflexus sp. TaxID=1971216 RepID=UPI002D70ACAC|nr:ATPase domain-containing protein [Oligoflexus sp.]HYX32327.1 ATPase domain-containing protein [Oligoflexus sp.]
MKKQKVAIRKLPTAVPGLDEILGGGLPEYSFNIIAGSPGGGKTTLVHQIMFANATPERPAIFFTVLGEPALKMLRYQQQYDFFDLEKVGTSVIFVNLSHLMLKGDLDAVLEAIVKKVETTSPSIVVVDSFRAMMRMANTPSGNLDIESFIQQLAFLLTSWQATTFLIGEYSEQEVRNNAVFTIADGLFWLSQHVERNSIVRKLQIIKLRGQASVPGLHTFRITDAGLQTFPRTFGLTKDQETNTERRRISCGVAELDVMMGGGIPVGDSMLVAGPTGSGKSLLGSNFIAEGLRQGEPGVIAIFEERPGPYTRRAETLGMEFKKPISESLLKILYLGPTFYANATTVHPSPWWPSKASRTSCVTLTQHFPIWSAKRHRR